MAIENPFAYLCLPDIVIQIECKIHGYDDHGQRSVQWPSTFYLVMGVNPVNYVHHL